MWYQAIIVLGLLGFMINLALNLKSLRTPRADSKLAGPVPSVSILVPARNEEANIETCLDSLRQQDHPSFEILVLDDESSDSTAAIVERIAAKDSRVQLVTGKPLRDGWAGKPFACHQLAERARGSWLLFVDADTIHAPHMLRSMLALATELDASLISGFPRQLATSLPQKVAIPVIYFIIMSWFPLWWLQRPGQHRPSLAIGQFLLFRTEEYRRIGGHEAVKARILEDVWLGIEIVRHGGRHVAVDLSPVVSCNMYRDVPAMWEGFIKWMYSIAAVSRAALAALVVAGVLFFLAPFYWLWNGLSETVAPITRVGLVSLQVAMIFAMRWLVDSRFKEPVVATLLHPIGFSFLTVTTVVAWWKRVISAGVSWKKRVYSSGSGVE